jgi:transposase
MGRGPVHPVETKVKIVLSVLSGECSQAEAARRHGISETSIGKWREQFVVGGKAGLAQGGGVVKPTGREAQQAAEIDELTRAARGGTCRTARAQARWAARDRVSLSSSSCASSTR